MISYCQGQFGYGRFIDSHDSLNRSHDALVLSPVKVGHLVGRWPVCVSDVISAGLKSPEVSAMCRVTGVVV